MAQPIPLELPPRDARRELLERLENAPVEHAAALLDAYEFLQELHDRRVLEVLRGALGAGDTLVANAVKAAESDASVRAMRNAVILGKMLASINPEVLEGVAAAVGETLGCYEKPVIEPPGFFALVSQFRHKELRRSMALINRFLEVLGNQIKLRGSCR